MAALAYAPWRKAQGGDLPACGLWTPSTFSDEVLGALGKKVLERAKHAVRGGLTAEVHRMGPSEPVPTVRLPTSTVRFWVQDHLAYAHCDCTLGHHCEHVAMAVWAFREADAHAPAQAVATVAVGAPAASAQKSETAKSPLAHVRALGVALLTEGVANVGADWAQRFAVVRKELLSANLTWPLVLVGGLEQALQDYRDRSARYEARRVAGLLADLEARVRATAQTGELPTAYILGTDEPPESAMDHARMISLGASVQADGDHREVHLFLADPENALVLCIRHRVEGKKDAPPTAEQVRASPLVKAARDASPLTLGGLAHGHLVVRGAKRQANREVTLKSAKHSLTPLVSEWDSVPEPLRIADLARFVEGLAARPPAVLRPPIIAEDIHVVAVDEVLEAGYDPGAQALHAQLRLKCGGELTLILRHQPGAPMALDVLAAALAAGPRYVSGRVEIGPHGVQMEPLAVMTDHMVVPGLDGDAKRLDLPAVELPSAEEPLHQALLVAAGLLHEAVHHGVGRMAMSWPGRARASADALRGLGLTALSTDVATLATQAARAASGEEADSPGLAAEAWLAASLRLELLLERAM
jgi:hypothetical protein